MRLALALALVALLAPYASADPAPLDERARAAVAKGRAWLERQQTPEGTFPSGYPSSGCHALAMWTLLECGAPSDDPAVQKTLAWLRTHADPAKGLGEHPNYGASLTLVALRSWCERRAAEIEPARGMEERLRAARRQLSESDRAWVERLVRYVRACCTGKAWLYTAIPGREAAVKPAGIPIVARAPAGKAPLHSGARMPWGSDNSNGQYGWLGIRAATLLGVALDDDRFVTEELDRLLRTPDAGTGSAIAVVRDGNEGFAGLWSADEMRENVTRLGWGYGNGPGLPTMTTGCIASLIYAWQEAEERGLMTDELRAQARAAVLGGIAELFPTTKECIETG